MNNMIRKIVIEMSLTFGRKINYSPLLVTLIISVLIGYFLFLISHQVSIGIIFGIISLIVIPFIYSLNLSGSYGYWTIDDNGINSSDYSTTGKKIKAILLPNIEKESSVKFDEIKSFSLVVGQGMSAPKGIGPDGAIAASFYVVDSAMQYYSSPYYLSLELNNGQEIDLDLSANADNKNEVEKAIKLIESNTDIKPKLMKQRV